jgi:hypothetical protein
VIIFGRCGRKNQNFGSPDGCDELGDQVREYQSRQMHGVSDAQFKIQHDKRSERGGFAGLGFASAPSREVCESILQSRFELHLKLVHPDDYVASS